MSLAKKSTLWLVAAIVVFALALTAFFAASPVTSASADTEVSTAVVVEASSSVNADTYPDLLYGTARTITAKYYFEVPASANEAQFFVAPVLVLPDNTTVKPTSITLNPALTDASIRFVSNYIAGTASFVDIDFDGPVVAGLTVSGETYTTVNNGYLFTATYDLANDAANGVYTFSLGSATEFALGSSATEYMPSVVNGGSAEKKGSFNIRKAVTIPVADAEAEPYVYNGSEQTFVFTTASLVDAAYINFANNVKTNAGTYTVTASLKDPAGTAWVGNTTADQTYTFTIEKKQVTIPTAVANLVYTGSAQTGVTVDYTDYTKASGTIEETAAGDYSATFALNDTANTEWADAELGEETSNKTVEWSIAYVLVTKPTATTTTYYYSPNTEQTYAFASVGDSDKYTVANNKRTNAGTQTVTATLANASYKWEDGTTADLEFTFTIKKLSVIAAACSLDNTFTYTGEEITCNFISEGQPSYFTITGHKQTNVGTYDVTETLNDPNNYKWSHFPNVSDDEPTAPYVQENAFQITKKAVTIPTAISGLEYTGSAQVGVNKVDGNFYELYSGSDEETAVGNYSATYNLKSTTNCYWAGDVTDVANKTVNWSIGKKQITKPSISASFKIYNGESQSYSGSGTGYSFTGSGTNVGEYPVTVSLTDKNNCVWAGTDSAADYSEADKLIIAKKTVRLTLTKSADSSVYGNAVATITAGINPDYAPINAADIGTVSYTAKSFQTNVIYTKAEFETIRTAPVANYILTAVCSVDNDNYSVEGQTLPYEITKRQIEIPVLNQDDPSFIYSGSETGISFFSGSLDDADYFTLSGTNRATNVGNYTYTATLDDATNCEWADSTTAAKNYDWSITTRYITVPTVEDDTFDYDGNEHSIGFSNVDNDYVDITYDTQSAIGVYTDTTTVALKAAHAGNIAWDDDGYTTEAKGFTLTINSVNVSITFVGVYNDVEKVLAEDVELAVFTDLPTYAIRWFAFDGYTFDNAAVTQATLALDGQTVIATYLYNVGAGDVNGDGFVTTADVLMMKQFFVTLQDSFTEIATADAAWAATDDEVENPVLRTALDVNESGSFRSSDILAVREALATGYSYAIIVNPTATGVTGQAVIEIPERLTITTYDVDDDYGWNFVKAVKGGYPIALGADISAATASFNEALVVPADIDLAGHTLTVNAFTMSNSAEDVTLKIWNSANTTGSIFTVEGISITAPNGNVIVSGVSGYSYEGTTVTLAAASSSLHVESNVGFYQYKVEGKATAQDYKETVTTDDAIDEVALTPETGVIATTQAKVAEMTAEKAALATLEAEKQALIDAGEEAEVINAKVDQINDKIADIEAIDVFKAPVSIPVDTHVVVEEEATLVVEQITVTEAQGANAATANTFSINVKNSEAEVITVDISEVKDTIEEVNYYHVEEVTLAGDTSKVEIVKAEDQTVTEVNGVKNETELKAALAAGTPVIEIGANFTVSSAISQSASYCLAITQPVTINGNGYTITMGKQNGIWIQNVDTVTINDLGVTTSITNGRCINTRGGVGTLNLNNVTLTCKGAGNNQAITVGGNHSNYVNINVTESSIDAGRAGYGFILFNKANINISESTAVCGYSVIYGREPSGSVGSHGSHVVIEDSVLTTNNPSTAASQSSFAMFADQDAWDYTRPYGTTVSVKDSILNITTTNTAKQAIFTGAFADVFSFDNCTFNLKETIEDTAVMTYPTIYSNDSELVTVTDEITGVITYTYKLVEAGVSNEIELFNAVDMGAETIILVDDIEISEQLTFDYDATLDLNGYAIYNTDDIWDTSIGSWSLVSVQEGATLTITGDGTLSAKAYDCYAIDVRDDSKLIIENGTFVGNVSAVYVCEDGGAVEVKGGEFSLIQLSSQGDYRFLLNCWDASYVNGTASFAVSGGTFYGFDPANNLAEGANTNFMADGFATIENDDEYTVVVVVDSEEELLAAIAAEEPYILLDGDVLVSDQVVFDYDATLDLSGYAIYNTADIWNTTTGAWSLVSVQNGAELTIIGNGTLSAKANDCYALDVRDGSTLIIEDGTFVGNVTAVYAYEGDVEINGGEFSIIQLSGQGDYRFLLNCLDASYVNGTASFVVSGGTFHGFDPADNAAEGTGTNFMADGYTTVEDEGVYTVEAPAMIEITTFAELAEAIAYVNDGVLVAPILVIANDIAFENTLEINKSVTIIGDDVTFVGFDASAEGFNCAFVINTTAENQTITIQGITFDHFAYYSDVANETVAVSANVDNATSVITYYGACASTTTLNVIDCTVDGTGRDMINASSTLGCAGTINIENCFFDASDRISDTFNMLSFYGKSTDGALKVTITYCTFNRASKQSYDWATTAIACFGNAYITVADCDFISCEIAIAFDHTFDNQFSASTFPVSYEVVANVSGLSFTDCWFGYTYDIIVDTVDEVPEEFWLADEAPKTFGKYPATQFTATRYQYYDDGSSATAWYPTLFTYYVLESVGPISVDPVEDDGEDL